MIELPKSRRLLGITAIILTLCLTAVVGCGNGNQEKSDTAVEPQVLFAYVGANLKGPVTELAESYEAETGTAVELTFQNAGALLNQIEAMQKGDIYIPGSMDFALRAQANGHVDQISEPIAYPTPVIVVPKDNPAGITSLADLAKQDVKLVIPDQEATAIGKTATKIFENAGLKDEIENNITASLESPAKVLAAIAMGQGDVGIVEYSNTKNHEDEIELIEIDPSINEVDKIPVTSLNYSENKELALDFMEYMQQYGPAAFEAHGFKIAP